MPKILVIEDEQAVRKNILDLLRAEGFQAIGAENGQVGVELAQEQMPDLIICDVMMPQLDGFGVLKALHQTPLTELIPFIFLTARVDRDDFRRGMTLGADDYLTKPFTRAELLEAIATRLAKQTAILQLKQNIEALKQSSLLKDEFIHTAAHELRVPLANIKMAVDMLQNIPDITKQRNYLEILQAECAREVDLINDLLDLQRLDAPIERTPLEALEEMPEWFLTIVEPFQVRAQERQQALHVTISHHLPTILTDPIALQRILTELLHNACKYTSPSGVINLEVFQGTEEDCDLLQDHPWIGETRMGETSNTLAPACIYIIVSNEAEIPADALPQVFDRFYRVPNGDPWSQGGTGLGLTLTKKLIERLQGSIQVISESGWTRFIVQLPLCLQNQE